MASLREVEIRRTHRCYVMNTGENISLEDYISLRELWESMGGKFYGPNVEHGSMPESRLLPFLRRYMERYAHSGGTEHG